MDEGRAIETMACAFLATADRRPREAFGRWDEVTEVEGCDVGVKVAPVDDDDTGKAAANRLAKSLDADEPVTGEIAFTSGPRCLIWHRDPSVVVGRIRLDDLAHAWGGWAWFACSSWGGWSNDGHSDYLSGGATVTIARTTSRLALFVLDDATRREMADAAARDAAVNAAAIRIQAAFRGWRLRIRRCWNPHDPLGAALLMRRAARHCGE